MADDPQHLGEDDPVPCAQALVAGTVALMTAWADPCPECAGQGAPQREHIARRIVSNLFFLSHHPYLASPLREVMARAHRRWVGVAQGVQGAPSTAASGAGTGAPKPLH